MTKVLAIGIHEDDSEYSIGGTLKLLKDRGCDVTILNIMPNLFVSDSDIEEHNKNSIAAAEVLGVKKIILDYPHDTRFYRVNEYTVRKTEGLIKEINPDIIFMMYPEDNHIEHVECAKTVKEALFGAAVGAGNVSPNEVYSVECGPYQTMCYFRPHFHVCIDSVMEKLEESIMAFDKLGIGAKYLWEEKRISAEFRGYEMATGTANARDGRTAKYAEVFRIEKFPAGNKGFILHEILNDVFCWSGTRMYHPNASEVFRK